MDGLWKSLGNDSGQIERTRGTEDSLEKNTSHGNTDIFHYQSQFVLVKKLSDATLTLRQSWKDPQEQLHIKSRFRTEPHVKEKYTNEP